MVVGVLILILAWAASFKAIILVVYALIIGLAFHAVIVIYEEPHLRKLFGELYLDYCARVPRWLPSIKGR